MDFVQNKSLPRDKNKIFACEERTTGFDHFIGEKERKAPPLTPPLYVQ
jgi:hypothetical protein